MKKLLILLCVLMCYGELSCLIGCTSPTQPWAERSLQLGQDKIEANATKLADLAYQKTLDEADRVIKESDDPKIRAAALQKLSNTYHKISFSEIQIGRAGELLRNTYEWVHSQRGFLSILWEDWQKASERIENKTDDDVIPDNSDPPLEETKEDPYDDNKVETNGDQGPGNK